MYRIIFITGYSYFKSKHKLSQTISLPDYLNRQNRHFSLQLVNICNVTLFHSFIVIELSYSLYTYMGLSDNDEGLVMINLSLATA